PSDEYTQKLSDAVYEFQADYNHVNQDGIFGPLTRRLLAMKLIEKLDYQPFKILQEVRKYLSTVFISYAWKDSHIVNKVDQWLRDRKINVVRDNRDFAPGQKIPEAITDAVNTVDKVIVIYSKNSKSRDWPQFERSLAEQQEQKRGESFIIYLVLDDTPLPKHDVYRISILAKGKKLKEVGTDILWGILGSKAEHARYEYDDDEIL
ncbi:MAG: toll/interleukin-1 receptor domain-containing protein, partial [Bacteroidota bacterium]